MKTQFPFFDYNQDITYLDNAATTQKPANVIDVINNYYRKDNVNVHRSSFKKANQLTEQYESARASVAQFIGASSAKNIVWSSGTTDSLNTICLCWARDNIKAGDVIIILASEHHANFVPWQQLAIRNKAILKVVNLLPNGKLDLDQYQALLKLEPTFVSFQHVSNVLGSIYPIKSMIKSARDVGAVVSIDGAQAVAHLEVDVEDLDCDFYSFSGHKMYGPTGIGVLYVHNRMMQKMQPYKFGGEMVEFVTEEHTLFRDFPHNLETGTPNIAGVLGLKAATEFIQTLRTNRTADTEQSLFTYLTSELEEFSDVVLLGDLDNNIGIASFYIEDESIFDVATMLDQQGVAIRSGVHCAMPLMACLNISGTIRVSIACYTDKSDIDKFIQALKNTLDILKI